MRASNQARQNQYRIMSVGRPKGVPYFYAKATSPVYRETPAEDFQPGDEGKGLCGTRDAAQKLAYGVARRFWRSAASRLGWPVRAISST